MGLSRFAVPGMDAASSFCRFVILRAGSALDDPGRSLRKQKGGQPMKRKMLGIVFLAFPLWTAPAAADTRFIVRNPSGLAALQQLCFTLGCSVSGGLVRSGLKRLIRPRGGV